MANINIRITTTDDENKKWIYKDIHENLALDPVKRDISSYYNAGAVQNSLLNLFRFKKGERLSLPDYGLNLEEYLYDPINTATGQAIGEAIANGFKKWEPRVSLINVEISADVKGNEYQILISYSIPLLGSNEYEMAYVLDRG